MPFESQFSSVTNIPIVAMTANAFEEDNAKQAEFLHFSCQVINARMLYLKDFFKLVSVA